MATIYQGILGPVSGKVGNVVGATWRGIDYLRILPANVTNPRTPAQGRQRQAFLLVMRFLSPLLDFIRIGYRGFADGMSAYNAAMSYVLRNAVVGDFPDQVIDFGRVLVSRGNLRGVVAATASSPQSRTIQVEWEDNSELGGVSAHDTAIVVVYNGDKMDVSHKLEAGSRSQGQAIITLPSAYVGDTVQVYLAFTSASAYFSTGNRNSISDSVYAGQVVVT